LGRIKITPELFGELGETYYKEYCRLHGWAYTSLAQIYKNPINNDRLEFKFGFKRILVNIPPEIQQEITEISKPSNKKEENPSFVYDYLACKAYQNDNPRYMDGMTPDDFRWVEVKTGYSELTQNQIDATNKIKIPLIRCRVANVMAPPEEVRIYWDEVNSEYLSRFKDDFKRSQKSLQH